MEAYFNWNDARAGWLRRSDVAGADTNQFILAWLLVCSDIRFRLDRRNAPDVRIDRSAVRVQLEETDSPPPGPTNSRGSF